MKLFLSVIAALAVSPALSHPKNPTASPVTEIITGIANDRLKANSSLISTLKVKAHHGIKLLEETWGPRIEEPGVWQGFLTWELVQHDAPSLEHDEEFKKAASHVFSSLNFTHVPFVPFVNLTKSVTAPVTETIFTTIKEGADNNEFEAATQRALDVAGAAEGCISGAHGRRIEDQNATVMVLGWLSAEAHKNFAMSDAVVETTQRFLKVGNIERGFHVTYRNFL